MKIVSQKTLDLFRGSGVCSWCYRHVKDRDPHHAIVKTGLGGGFRIDLSINLASVCRRCHNEVHGKDEAQYKERFLALIAARENLCPEDIRAVLDLIKRLPKRCDPAAFVADLSESAKVLLYKALEEGGV